MADRSEDLTRRASDQRFTRGRADLAAALRALLGATAPEPLADADHAAAVAAEAGAAQRAAADHAWAVVRHEWATDDRESVTAVVHALSALLGPRPAWLIVPGREPQAVGVASDAVLDNPLGFAALAEGGELIVVDQTLPAGVWLCRLPQPSAAQATAGWELEAWGTEPWLSAATRALRERRARRPTRE